MRAPPEWRPGGLAEVPPGELYAITGIGQLPFNTIYQLAAERALRNATTMLMIPDLLAYWLTGAIGAEVTNASTTSLFDVLAQTWAMDVIGKAGLPPHIFPPLRRFWPSGRTAAWSAAEDRIRA